MGFSTWTCASTFFRSCIAAAILALGPSPSQAATVFVAAGSNLQAALDAAQPGDTILLQEGSEFVGTFILPVKPAGPVITVRSSAPDSLLPPDGERLLPAHAPLLARIRSGTSGAALRTAPGARGWRLQYLEFSANLKGYGDLLQIGDGSSAQNTLASMPRDIVLDHVYVHGDPDVGQKRCIALNAANVTIRDSYIAECKAVGQDAQAIGGWNGTGPYVIENNYIEGSGENVLFGGSDPAISGLVADGVTFRRNHVSRPMAWKLPIISQPVGLAAAASTGGSLPAGTYAYRVVARRQVGQGVMGRSTASVEVTATVANVGGTVRVTWKAVPGASEYRVYGRTAGTESMYWTVTGTEFVDDGRAGVSEAVPTSAGTVWLVKNLFELKNARNVVVEDNVFENHWKDAQAGYAIVLTPRNSGGTCTWCVVEDVRFERNVVRNVAAGFNILGYDSPEVSAQTRRITLRNNLVHNVVKSLGGNAWFAMVGDEPRDLVIDHNTIQFEGTTLVNTYGGTSTAPRVIYGLTMTNNATRHSSYGMGGSYFSYGLGILTNYYPDAVFAGNYLAGGSASRYPAGNFFTGVFEDQFVNAAAGDFTLRPDSPLRGAAVGGGDIGADIAAVTAGTEGVVEGRLPNRNTAPTASFTISCTDLTCRFADTSVDQEGSLRAWAWAFGDGTTAAEPSGTHLFGAAGTYVVSLTVTDEGGLTASHAQTVTVTAPNAPPTADIVVACQDLSCSFTDASSDVDGVIAQRRWIFSDGTSGTEHCESRTFATPGTYSVELDVVDDRGATAVKTRTVTVTRTLHVGGLTGSVTTWKSYWSTDPVVTVHDGNEQPLAGATVSVQWTGAVVKTGSCVTGANGQCTVKSGTLSGKRTSVTLTVVNVSSASNVYLPEANHDAGGSTPTLTLYRR